MSWNCLESADERFSEGDNVVATGYKIGMAVHGGFGEIVHLLLTGFFIS